MPSQMETKVKKVVQQLLTGAEAMQQSSEETVHLQPDKSAIITIIEQLQTVLFPDYFIKKKVSHTPQNTISAPFWTRFIPA